MCPYAIGRLWCIWLSRALHTGKVLGSTPSRRTFFLLYVESKDGHDLGDNTFAHAITLAQTI